ncbi:MAG: S9 family peptidase [Acidobacteria bacterium]|nr:S9 family peptidase [Acidobacteriota bacterium]
MRALLLLALAFALSAADKVAPTVDRLIETRAAGGARISPDGKWVAYSVTAPDWKADAFVSQIWLVEVTGGKAVQLTRATGTGASNAQWSPDSRLLTFTTSRDGGKAQVYAIRPDGGEAFPLTKSETAVGGYEWAPDGKWIAYVASEPEAKPRKERKESFGEFEVVRRDYSFQQLSVIDAVKAMDAPQEGKALTKGTAYTVTGFQWAPDSTRIAFSATRNPDLTQSHTSDIWVLTVADGTAKKIVDQPYSDNDPKWSPDGAQIVFSSAMGKAVSHANRRLAVVSANGGAVRSITDGFDENPSLVEWRKDGVYFSGLQKTASHLFRVDAASGKITRVTPAQSLLPGGFSFTADGETMAFSAASPTTLSEIYVSPVARFAARKLTDFTAAVSDLVLGTREVISWKSKDGALIEGILIKPAEFDASKKYPLLCIIHGGPTGIDRPALLDARYYPSDIWAARGAVILKVNYRGSAGYGEKFRQLNVRNLGVGDAWDVISGVDHLIAQGFVDAKRVGCMGWSQGGYISAFLTTSSDRFAAISVGAGISNWATYYYNTDITQFTINYLGADPAKDPEIYRKTSPMTHVLQAKTPTLIQHGELDRRVPIANAYELRQGLENRGVPVEMIVYKGYGHGITKPKSMRAVMNHNLAWFNHHLWNDPPPDFTIAK